ncbi:hypothetical protein [Helicobacter pylori]|uniref:hypothetical protein n=1 Tax=Helicobacter pylori TaxID=210 RepID=UPI001F53B6CA|nr:hypothetical protein [Helicobacter pylori]
MRKRLNALWTLKLCKISMIETQSESQTLPQHQPEKSLNAFSVGVSLSLWIIKCL